MDKIKIINAVISKIKDEGEPDKIEVKDLNEYDTPSKIPDKDNNGALIPDLAVHNHEELNLFEIELEETLDAAKWKRMSSYARKHKGHLYLVVPDFLMDRVKEELKSSQVNAGLIYFNTVPES